MNLRLFILAGEGDAAAVGSVFDGIIDEVIEDLADGLFIGPSGQILRLPLTLSPDPGRARVLPSRGTRLARRLALPDIRAPIPNPSAIPAVDSPRP